MRVLSTALLALLLAGPPLAGLAQDAAPARSEASRQAEPSRRPESRATDSDRPLLPAAVSR
jgi:hypothetical protein